ncbi:HAD family hydrolase [Janthinobacterium sp.]|uniref:HAD family hydrolase n=1 Tax=Janthinobacterium sp. TaxID=1871054 RepID=UPI00293D35BB|nr:HAD family hydrolase [Janthinobacterium sp.]
MKPSSPPRPKAILFDLDDTLWPIRPVIVAAEIALHDWLAQHAPRVARQFSIETLRERRLALLAEQPHYHVDLGALRRAGLHAAFAQAGEDAAKVEAAMTLFFAARNAVTPYEDVLPGLARLRGRILLGSISNGNADLAAIGMARHFQVSLAAARFGSAKPDAAIFHAACAGLGVAPAEAVYVGDDLLLDVAGAQNAGLRAVWMRRAEADLPEDIRPDAICATFDALLAWLLPQLEE